jgi:hypothetical protein
MIFTLITSPSENPSESPLKSPKSPKRPKKTIIQVFWFF